MIAMSVLLFLGAALNFGGWLLGQNGFSGRPISSLAAMFSLALAISVGWGFYLMTFGYRNWLGKGYRRSPIRIEKILYQFTPLRVITKTDISEGSTDWTLIPTAAEFLDGFVLMRDARSGSWIPKHAFGEAFSAGDLAGLLREKVKKYEVIDRLASLPETSQRRRGHARES